jgi:hypothetical protein
MITILFAIVVFVVIYLLILMGDELDKIEDDDEI